jgi:hypothetical protein
MCNIARRRAGHVTDAGFDRAFSISVKGTLYGCQARSQR